MLFRTAYALLLAATLAGLAAPTEVSAQQVTVVVNGEPITAYDIDQRIKLIALSGSKPPARSVVIEELIDEKLKIQVLRKFNIGEGMDNDVENAFANMARRMRMTPRQFTEQLNKAGITVGTLKSRIRAEISWSQIIRGRFQSSFQFSEKDIMAKLETRADKAGTGFDYTLRPIVFLVAKPTPELLAARRREAEALRSRFQSCEAGIGQARELRDVAVRTEVVRSTADLPPALREILEKTEIGKLTSPEQTAQGIEVYALCGKKPSSADNAPGKREVREELMSEQFKILSTRYLKELRTQAMIEYREPR
jgi:peptidyl-prolyl cis-trans isomerase SurA